MNCYPGKERESPWTTSKNTEKTSPQKTCDWFICSKLICAVMMLVLSLRCESELGPDGICPYRTLMKSRRTDGSRLPMRCISCCDIIRHCKVTSEEVNQGRWDSEKEYGVPWWNREERCSWCSMQKGHSKEGPGARTRAVTWRYRTMWSIGLYW